MRNEWLASGGTYLILGTAWLVAAVMFVVLSLRLGKERGQEADGCVLAIGTFVTLSVGGGIGLLLAPFPWTILSTLGLGLLFPGLLVAYWIRKK